MKRTITGLLAALLLLTACSHIAHAAEAPWVSAQAAVVYHPRSGRVLLSSNGGARHLIASTTKIMTALVALEHCGLEDVITATAHMANVEGSSMYLQPGEDYTLEQLLYGLMLASGNDAATAIAIHTAGSEEAFAELMNQKAMAIGMVDTHFENPHGLDGTAHYSTALDMARLMACAMENSTFARIAGTRSITIKGLTYVNHNKLLWQCEGVKGGKTGYTMAAGRTLVTVCERGGETLICVTLGAPDDWNDHKRLYDWAYTTWETRVLLTKDTRFLVPMVSGDDRLAAVEPLRDVTVFLGEGETGDCTIELPPFLYGPVHIGDKLGRILVTENGVPAGVVPLVAMEDHLS